MARTELPVAFHFSVSFTGDGPSISDAAFQEVSGLETSLDVEPVVEGGENRFIHQLPKPAKRGNLKLKRGLTDKNGDLVKWCKDTIDTDLAKRIQPKGMVIDLLDEEGEPAASWTLGNAYPVKWSIGSFDAMKNELAIETIELVYTTLKRNV